MDNPEIFVASLLLFAALSFDGAYATSGVFFGVAVVFGSIMLIDNIRGK